MAEKLKKVPHKVYFLRLAYHERGIQHGNCFGCGQSEALHLMKMLRFGRVIGLCERCREPLEDVDPYPKPEYDLVPMTPEEIADEQNDIET